MLSVTPASTA
jgi:integrase